MEQVNNLITGCFVERQGENRPSYEEDSEEEDEDGDMAFSFKDMSGMGHGKNVANYHRPKVKTGDLIDLYTGKLQRIRGPFHLPDAWWQITVLRTKTTKDKHKEPKDAHALCYRLRDDGKRLVDRVVHLFISKIGHILKTADLQQQFNQIRTQFELYLRSMDQENDLDLLNLKERLEGFCDSLKEEERELPVWFKIMVLDGTDFRHIRLSQTHPSILHYCSQLFPFHFNTIISFEPEDLADLAQAIEEEPGNLAFKAIVSKLYNITNCETSSEALIRSGLISKVPQHVQDAIKIYEYLKRETKEMGHTYVQFDRIMDVLGPIVEMFEEALDFLNKNKVTKTQMDGSYRVVYLMPLWNAENKIAKGLNYVQQLNEEQPWQLEVDFERPDFESIRSDPDQLRAAKLITTQPIVTISGKGGCGKTYVVTKVLMAARASRSRHTANLGNPSDMDTQPPEDYDDLETQGPDEEEGLLEDEPMEENKEKCPDELKILLTAPTGKAANLLGKRAGMPSYTLHQIIWSYPPKNGMDWKHKDANVLVVDECSLVSVTTFSYLIEILQKHAQLRRIVLLGDIRQLPSIEPGNFLSDTFQSLDRIGCAIELRTNHRAESQLIVDNATRISKKMYPQFDNRQFIMRKLPETNPGETGDDYLCQDISEEVTKLLLHEMLQNDVNSQFISFTRRVCDSINDLCCKKYSGHRMKENGKYAFRTKDKICCTRNGYVDVYREVHGLMTCKKESSKSPTDAQKVDSQGGVDRFDNVDDHLANTTAQGLNTTAAQGLNTTAAQGLNTTAAQGLNKTADAASNKEKEYNSTKNKNQTRLCNGEIFFILNEVEKQDDHDTMKTFLHLSDKDPEEEFTFWVEKRQLRKMCKIRHAWARTIHTFQGSETDHVVYIVGSKSRRQNWQHVYTAITRGRKTVFIVSVESTLREAIKRSEIRRQTGLRKQLVEKFQKNPNFNATMVGMKSGLNLTISSTQQGPSNIIKHSSPAKSSTRVVTSDNSSKREKTNSIMGYFTRGDNSMPSSSTNLNSTQHITDVLSSLAAEHDNEDIEEYDSDGSDSLLTKVKPKPKTDNIEEYDSDSSDSLLIKPNSDRENFKKQNQAGNSTRGLQGELHHDKFTIVDKEENECENRNGIELDEKIVNNNDEDMSQSLLVTQPDMDCADDRSLNIAEKKKGRLSKKNNGSRTVFREKGSGPLHTGQDCQGVSVSGQGVSNIYKYQDLKWQSLTPGFNKRLNEPPSTSSPCLNAPNLCSLKSLSSPIMPVLQESRPSRVTSPRANWNHSPRTEQEIDDIADPKSNESQWSDANDSEYLKLDDTSLIQTKIQNSKETDVTKVTDQFTTLKQSKIMQTPNVFRDGLKRPLRTPSNMSTNSLWSEADEDIYTSLDLDDIQNMAKSDCHGTQNHTDKIPGNVHEYNRLSPDSNIQKPSVEASSPVMFDSPQASVSSHLTSPGNKRHLTMADDHLANKRRQTENTITVSPLKRSLAKLEFK